MLLDDDFLKKEKPYECDFKDWLFRDDNAENLKKWVRYSVVDYGDADQVIKGSKIFEKLGWSSKYIDCIYSFKTYFWGFLRVYLTKLKLVGKLPSGGYILDNYDSLLVHDRINRVKDIYGIEETTANELWEQLNRFAKNTHTLGNYMPCPNGKYNRIKGFGNGRKYFQDRIDRLYGELEKNNPSDYIDNGLREEYKKWFDKYKEDMVLSSMLVYNDYFCPTVKRGRYEVCWIEEADDLKAYLKYMKKVNELIEERGKKIVSKLSEIH